MMPETELSRHAASRPSRLRRRSGRALLVAVASLVCLAAVPAAAIDLLWESPYSSAGEAQLSVRYPGTDVEAADDFEVEGLVERLIVRARNDCFGGCLDPPVPADVVVRFYEWTVDGPGALQDEIVLPDGHPGFLHDRVGGAGMLDLTLPSPFRATGWHFVSVQLRYDEPFNWRIAASRAGGGRGSFTVVRDLEAGGPWEQARDFWGDPIRQDLSIDLWGVPDGAVDPPPVIGCGEWAETDPPTPEHSDWTTILDFATLPSGEAWAVGSSDRSIDGHWETREQSYVAFWDGASWSDVPAPSPAPAPSLTHVQLNAVAATGPSRDAEAWAVGHRYGYGSEGLHVGYHVYAMHWDGSSWQDAHAPIPQDISAVQGASGDALHDVHAFATDDVWMVGRWFVAEPTGAVRWPGAALHWDGSDFEVHVLPMVAEDQSQWMLAVDGVAPDDLWTVGAGGGSQIYHWDGTSWSHVPGPAPGLEHELHDLAALASDDVWAGGWWRDEAWVQHPLLLHWDGTSWTRYDSPAGGSELAAWSSDAILAHGVGGYAFWDGTEWSAARGPTIIPWGFVQSLEAAGPCEAWTGGKKAVPGTQAPLAMRLSPVTVEPDPGTGFRRLDPRRPGVPTGLPTVP